MIAAYRTVAGNRNLLKLFAGEFVSNIGDWQSGRFTVDQVDPGTLLPRRLRAMGPDEVFGELGLMHNAPRSATVTAESDGRLLALDGPDFLELLNAGPEVSGRMLERYRASAAPRS
jgi:CRP-like cAMP-binding protein